MSSLHPQGQLDQKKASHGRAAPSGPCALPAVVSRFLTAFPNSRLPREPSSAFLASRAVYRCQGSMSLLSWRLWRHCLSILYSTPERKLPRQRVKSHEKTGPHRKIPWTTEIAAPSCTTFCYLITCFTQNLMNQKASVYFDHVVSSISQQPRVTHLLNPPERRLSSLQWERSLVLKEGGAPGMKARDGRRALPSRHPFPKPHTW